MKLKISKEISLPLDAVTETIATIGRKGAGKTYLATLIAEQMIDAGAQVVAIDPVGNWYGLRIGADGKSEGKDIFIIGGEHGDVPLIPEAGVRIAQLLVEKGISAILDISGFRLGERKRFATDFGEELLHLKKTKRTPMHIFIEEAQLIIPQRVGPEEARMVGAFEQIVRLGRNYGIGCTLVTQRPQSVNKEVLSQVECLCVLQVTGPHERKALEAWVQEAGADRKLVGELPGLAMGEGYVWSPSWLRTYQRVRFLSKTTFDASATPEVGKAMKAARLSSVDVDKLRSDMADVVAKAEKDNPKVLRREIAELQRDLMKTRNTQVKQNPVKIERIEVPTVGKRALEGLKKSETSMKRILAAIKDANARTTEHIVIIEKNFSKFSAELTKVENKNAGVVSRVGEVSIGRVAAGPVRERQHAGVPPRKYGFESHPPLKDGETSLTNPEQRILNAIAWMESIDFIEPNQTAIAFLSGYTAGGGAFNNPKGSLRTKGLVEYRGSNRIALTDAGRQMASMPEMPLTTEELHKKVLSVLPGPEKKLLKALIEIYPNDISNEELAERAGYAPHGGAFNNPRGRLRSLGLIEYRGSRVVARPILFLED